MDYNGGTIAGAATGATASGGMLAQTGANIWWLVLAGFAIIALGAALMRIVPKWGVFGRG